MASHGRASQAGRTMSEPRVPSLEPIVAVVRRLLGEGGCPWDREQTLESLRPYLLEEAFETVEAIDAGGADAIREELGDLVFLTVFLAELTRARFGFDLEAIAEASAEKMTRRHPWVFGDHPAHDVGEAIAAWEARKATEKRARGRLSGVPTSLPALLRALRVGEKAGSVGYDWPDAVSVRAKVDEELRELDEAAAKGSSEEIERELGDVLFALSSYARKQGIDPESALRGSLDRFSARFRRCEMAAEREGRDLASMTDEERDALFDAAKAEDARARGEL